MPAASPLVSAPTRPVHALNSFRYSGHGTETKFDLNVQHKERLIRKAMVAYLGAASEFTGELSIKRHFALVCLTIY